MKKQRSKASILQAQSSRGVNFSKADKEHTLDELIMSHMEDLKKIISQESLSEWSNKIKADLVSIFFQEIPVFGNKTQTEGDQNNIEIAKNNNEKSMSSLHPEIDESKQEELEEVITTNLKFYHLLGLTCV